jgi:hypothetical protein
LVPAAGIEPATFRSGGERSNPLSYAGLKKIAGFKEVIKNVPLFVPLFAPLVNNGCSLLEVAGRKCEALMFDRIHDLYVQDVEFDDLWAFIGMKAKTNVRKGIDDPSLGDAWTFKAIERHSKLILAWHLRHRTYDDTVMFTENLAWATDGSFQITTPL